jgi:tetratricopeptide (TPR) repeat protein
MAERELAYLERAGKRCVALFEPSRAAALLELAANSPAADFKTSARLWQSAGRCYVRAELFAQAHVALRRAAEGAGRGGDLALLRGAWQQIATTLLHEDRHEEALGYASRAAELSRQAGDAGGEAAALTLVGNACAGLGRPDEAERAYDGAVRLCARPDSSESRAQALQNKGILVARQGRLDEAESLYREALEIQHRLDGAPWAVTLGNLGSLLLRRGRLEDAEANFSASLRMHIDKRYYRGACLQMANLAIIALHKGAPDVARSKMREAVAFLREHVSAVVEGEILRAWRKACAELGVDPAF